MKTKTQNQAPQKRRFSVKLTKKTWGVILGVAVIACGLSADYLFHRAKTKEASKYLYNAEFTESEEAASDESDVKILGEATLVDAKPAANEDTYFVSAVANRERSRDEALETLQTVIDSSESLQSVKDEALQSMINIASAIETESLIEERVKAKGFTNCFTVIKDGKASVIVETPGLLTNEVALITEIAVEETGFSPECVTITEKRSA